ncbi:hypothetical protein bcere0022_35980 [Bacillus cereus Rock3-44]|nr:hypothetical protein bcere0022_35980 [Bacillus cereus Rock3-44]
MSLQIYVHEGYFMSKKSNYTCRLSIHFSYSSGISLHLLAFLSRTNGQ